MKKISFIKTTLAMLIGASALAVSVGCDHDRHDRGDRGSSVDVHIGSQNRDRDDH